MALLFVFLFLQALLQSDTWGSESTASVKRLIKYCFRSRAKSTVTKYLREVHSFFRHQISVGLPCLLPAKVTHLALYLSALLGKNRVSAVCMAHAALKWVHGILPIDYNPLDCGICRNLLETEKRQRTEPIKKKEPVSLELIKSIIRVYAHEDASLKDLRTAVMCVLSFVGLFRSSELLEIKACNITLCISHIVIRIPNSKTDIYRQGQDVFIPKSDKFTCPCRLFERYLKLANISLVSCSDYVFRNVVFLKSSGKYVLGKRKVSYTCFRDLFKECLKKLGYDQKLYSLHSFRSGGATSIVSNLKNCTSKERLLKLHGRWKSDIAKDMYIKEDITERLRLPQSLGL